MCLKIHPSVVMSMALMVASAVPASAQSPSLDVVELTSSNDIVSGTDDLYTAELGMDILLDGRRLRFDERMFTDREAGRRHDETSLVLVVDLEPWLGEGFSGSVGGLRVGKGLFGESFQNAAHGVFGADEVQLAYPGGTDWFPLISLDGDWSTGQVLGQKVWVDATLVAAPGFRSWLDLQLTTRHAVTSNLELEASAGVMANHVESNLIANHVDTLRPIWSAGVRWRGIGLTWSANTFGTSQRHLSLSYRFGGGRTDRPQ